ncbi:hypothetical protein L798_00814 [Zootermopsis nevadensis]|uniref:Uncharacterized protein n=1 Tax=Zootermopsis nevadensis TaxID=136037 RepID=A0A067QIF0_ZOONE|nr:hypothetical protein L798_00814 [Zootermopsis nevadensis]
MFARYCSPGPGAPSRCPGLHSTRDKSRFQFLTEANEKYGYFYDVATLIKEATRASETSVNLYQTTVRESYESPCDVGYLEFNSSPTFPFECFEVLQVKST